MPLGFERLNERTQRPNALINFIRTLPGPTSSTAEGILNRVAAICYPFMKKNMIFVQALEEFPYNNEFVGRNFNAGEVIQLVLRNKQGQWLPEHWVMMVMVHELAHCKQMNHSKAFWKVRDEYAGDLRELWGKGYTGEGMWGRGRGLETGEIHDGSVAVGDVPEHLCGGTYSRRKKRGRGGKVKEELTYAEKKQRRILKKFGAGGQAVGADDDTKVKLEGGVAKKGKPRVAGSARGRELRAAAALARFEPVKKEEEVNVKDEPTSDSETEDEYEDVSGEGAAIDVDGKKMVDEKGRALVKICEDEDGRDENARREMEEFLDIGREQRPGKPQARPKINTTASAAKETKPNRSSSSNSTIAKPSSSSTKPAPSASKSASPSNVIRLDEIHKRRPEPPAPKPTTSKPPPAKPTTKPPPREAMPPLGCPICSLNNEPGSLICAACSNVLNPDLTPNHWRCRNATCRESGYINSGDAGRCGVCGTSRSGN